MKKTIENVSTSPKSRNSQRGSYSSAITRAKKAVRREEAEVRNEEYRGLSLKQKLVRVASRPGKSIRETNRLTKPKAAPAK